MAYLCLRHWTGRNIFCSISPWQGVFKSWRISITSHGVGLLVFLECLDSPPTRMHPNHHTLASHVSYFPLPDFPRFCCGIVCTVSNSSGLRHIGNPKKGETIFISVGAGAIGQIISQLTKHEGLSHHRILPFPSELS